MPVHPPRPVLWESGASLDTVGKVARAARRWERRRLAGIGTAGHAGETPPLPALCQPYPSLRRQRLSLAAVQMRSPLTPGRTEVLDESRR
jgi:hypothetical protein